jgi:hypothetical protein
MAAPFGKSLIVIDKNFLIRWLSATAFFVLLVQRVPSEFKQLQ